MQSEHRTLTMWIGNASSQHAGRPRLVSVEPISNVLVVSTEKLVASLCGGESRLLALKNRQSGSVARYLEMR